MGFTTLTAQVNPLDVTIQVADPSVFVQSYPQTFQGLPGSLVTFCDGEFILLASFTGKTLNVAANGRGYLGTVPSVHLVGSFIDVSPTQVGAPYGNTMPGYIHARKVGEQWDLCDRCGFSYPMSQLMKQKGLLLCTRHCVDDLTIERRQVEIMRIQGAGVQQEGADLRVIDRSFWIRSDEEVS